MPRLTPHGHANLPIGESALFHEFRANQEIGVPGRQSGTDMRSMAVQPSHRWCVKGDVFGRNVQLV